MAKCEYCGVEVELPFKCNFCERILCIEHRLPENHACIREPPRTSLGSWQSKKTLRAKKSKWNIMESEGDFHFRKKKAVSYKPHKKKSLPIKKIVGVCVVLAIVTILIWQSPAIISLLSSSNPSNPFAGYTQIQVYRVGSYVGIFSEKVGEYSYYFVYYPDTIYPALNQTYGGFLSIWRQDVVGSTDFPLTTNISHDYYGMTFVITQVKPDYVIVMVKSAT